MQEWEYLYFESDRDGYTINGAYVNPIKKSGLIAGPKYPNWLKSIPECGNGRETAVKLPPPQLAANHQAAGVS
ncbi:MAG: hypothetical protein GY805_13385 [Chloroflexi bacterium]|nr:hypothetical protein [Chloroflexota bacterium]